MIIYSVIFILPAVFICNYVPKTDKSIGYKFALPKKPLLVILGTIGVISIVNTMTNILKVFVEMCGIHFYPADITIPRDITGIILFLIYSTIIPAVVEELLFRKVILDSLLPYGTLFSIIASSLLFSLMHCNPSQSLYTFAAGIVLAAVAVKTNSIIFPIIIHFSNNLLSCVYMLLFEFASEETYTAIVLSTDTVFKLFGVCFFIYLYRKKTLEYDNENKTNFDFPILKSSVRILFAAYILYTAFLSMRWIYIK